MDRKVWFRINGIKRSLIPSDSNTKKKPPNHFFRLQKQPKLGILAFETAKTMSRLVSLYKSLSDAELLTLRSEIIKFEGVTLLNSKDESFLLKLAYAEKLEEIDSIAVTVSRFAKKCSDQELNQFEQVYSDLKHDTMINSSTLNFGSKDARKIVRQMEKFINATSRLYSGFEALAEMEISEQRIIQWKNQNRSLQGQKTNYDLFNQKISWQRQQVRYLKQISLWGQTFNKIISLLARIVCIVYARIRNAFSPYISVVVLPSGSFRQTLSAEAFPPSNDSPVTNVPVLTKSGPIPKNSNAVKFWSRELNKPLRPRSIDIGVNFAIGFRENRFFGLNGIQKISRLVHQAPPSTLGGSGLALRYANVIIVAEKYQNIPDSLNETGREDLYEMLPENIRKLVRTKMKKIWRRKMDEDCDPSVLVEYWREKLKEIMVWFAPMAHNTVRWQQERSFEKRNFDAKPKVLLLQTLFFADRETTEKMIAEVLVRLTWMYRYGLLDCL